MVLDHERDDVRKFYYQFQGEVILGAAATSLPAQLETTIGDLKQFDEAIAKLFATHPDFSLFQSLPGAGEVYASRLLAIMGTQRDRWTNAEELDCLVGIAPVIERSGQSLWIRWRYFCPKFMRQSFHEYDGESSIPSGPGPTTNARLLKVRVARRLSARSLTSGSESSGSAGKPVRLHHSQASHLQRL